MANSSQFIDLFKTQPTRERLAEVFDGFEADITYIDDKEIVVYFSPFRIFNRSASILGQSMFDCHSPKSYAAINEMLDAFKSGAKDKVSHSDVHEKSGRTVQVCYQAMRDEQGVYLGCLEAVTYRD